MIYKLVLLVLKIIWLIAFQQNANFMSLIGDQ